MLLAENNTGYANLMKIVSRGFTEGYYYKPRVDMEVLQEFHEGIIALSACLAGEVPRFILKGMKDEARKAARKYEACFGKGNYFLELQDHGIPEQRTVNMELLQMSRELDIPLVTTYVLLYTYAEDAIPHDILLCLQTGKKLADEDRMRYEGGQYYVKSEEEMKGLFPYAWEAVENTQRIADRCNVEIEFGVTKLPKYDVPEGYSEDQRDVPGGFTAEPDIMDTWATSSLTPQIVTRWEEPGEENQAIFNATFPMDLRPQGQDIIRTWLFSTVDRAHLENKCLPWANATLSGWILDPDHKKMSKSKGNVVVPDKPIKQFGADAVRYWAAAARLGLDATYDEGQMKIGRRLAIKLLNATKFALAIGREDENHHVGAPATASWNPADVTEPLDRAAMAKMALVVREATESLNNYEHSKALEVIENYFWQFCDDYI